MNAILIAKELTLIARQIMAINDSGYKYDPYHKHKPKGSGWNKTEKGWSKRKKDNDHGKHKEPTQGNQSGHSYQPTNDFRGIQRVCSKISASDSAKYHSGSRKIDERIRERLSLRIQSQLRSSGCCDSNRTQSLVNPKLNSTVKVHQNVPGDLFHDIFECCHKFLQKGDCVDLHCKEDYRNNKNFILEDGLAGFSITKDGDLVSVFSLSNQRGFLDTITPIVKEHCKSLDCFKIGSTQKGLPELYAEKFEFKTASVLDFNYDVLAEDKGKEYAEHFKNTYGEAPVHFMVNTDKNIEVKHFNKEQWNSAKAYQLIKIKQSTNKREKENGKSKHTTQGNQSGHSYQPTNDFRGIHRASVSMDDSERKCYHNQSKILDETLRSRLAKTFRRQLGPVHIGSGNGVRLLNSKDGTNTDFHVGVNGDLFHDIFEICQSYLPKGDCVDVHSSKDYKDCKNYLSEDGLSGFSITPDGDLVSVFNLSNKRGFLKTIAPIVKQECRTLDCFNSKIQQLPKYYHDSFGFKTASILDFNYDVLVEDKGKEYTDHFVKTYGEAPVHFMVNSDEDIEVKHFNKEQWEEAKSYQVISIKQSANKGENENEKVKRTTQENQSGHSYQPTNDFRRIHRASVSMDAADRKSFQRGSRRPDGSLLNRISGVLRSELKSWSSGNRNAVELLNPKTGKSSKYHGKVPANLFHDTFEICKSYLQNGDCVDIHGSNDYTNNDNYLSEDGLSGFSITPDGDLISVFNLNPEGGFLKTIAPIVKEKCKSLDCFASNVQNLPEFYRRFFDFKTASVLDFNYDMLVENKGKEYADNFVQVHGEAPVHFMVNSEDDVEVRRFNKDQYDEAKSYQLSRIKSMKSERKKGSPKINRIAAIRLLRLAKKLKGSTLYQRR